MYADCIWSNHVFIARLKVVVTVTINLILGCKIFIDRKRQILLSRFIGSHDSTIFIGYPFDSSEGNGKR